MAAPLGCSCPRPAPSAANAVSLLYNLSAIQSPFNPDGSSVWKYGSTIPVKVKITEEEYTSKKAQLLKSL